jgi:hypothetical protein
MQADWNTYLMELVGTFANSKGVIVGTPFEIGLGRSLVVPIGATQLRLGVNDDFYHDNGGFWNVRVSQVPEPSSFVLLVAGVALLGWAVRQRRGTKRASLADWTINANP